MLKMTSSNPENAKTEMIAQLTWIWKWIDYTSKYGLGFMLSNGTVGIYFNDGSKIVMSGDHPN